MYLTFRSKLKSTNMIDRLNCVLQSRLRAELETLYAELLSEEARAKAELNTMQVQAVKEMEDVRRYTVFLEALIERKEVERDEAKLALERQSKAEQAVNAQTVEAGVRETQALIFEL